MECSTLSSTPLTREELILAHKHGLYNDSEIILSKVKPKDVPEYIRKVLKYVDFSNINSLPNECVKFYNTTGRILVLKDVSKAVRAAYLGGYKTACFDFNFVLNFSVSATSTTSVTTYQELETLATSTDAELFNIVISVSSFLEGKASIFMSGMLAMIEFLYKQEIPSDISTKPYLENIWKDADRHFYVHFHEDSQLLIDFNIKIDSKIYSIYLKEGIHFTRTTPAKDGSIEVTFHQESILTQITQRLSDEAKFHETMLVRSQMETKRLKELADYEKKKGNLDKYNLYSKQILTKQNTETIAKNSAGLCRHVSEGFYGKVSDLTSGKTKKLDSIVTREISAGLTDFPSPSGFPLIPSPPELKRDTNKLVRSYTGVYSAEQETGVATPSNFSLSNVVVKEDTTKKAKKSKKE